MTVERMLVEIANLGRPVMLAYSPIRGTWTLHIASVNAPAAAMSSDNLKEVVREAHREFHAA